MAAEKGETMKKFSRMPKSESGGLGGVSGSGSSSGVSSYFGKVFAVGRYQVTVEELVAEGMYEILPQQQYIEVILLHKGHEMFRDTPVSPYLDKATRPALIHLWVNNLFSFQRKILAPSPNMSPDLPLKPAKVNGICCCLKNFETGIRLEIMLAAYTIQLELTPCLSSSTGRVGVCLKDNDGSNLLCQHNGM